jgi:hypothetical protein
MWNKDEESYCPSTASSRTGGNLALVYSDPETLTTALLPPYENLLSSLPFSVSSALFPDVWPFASLSSIDRDC